MRTLKSIFILVVMTPLVCLQLFAGNERGGANSLENFTVLSFDDLSQFLKSDKIYTYSKVGDRPILDWLAQDSLRNPNLSNLEMIRYYLDKNIEIRFRPIIAGPCTHNETDPVSGETYSREAAVCMDITDEENPYIEFARSEFRDMVADKLLSKSERRDIFTFLGHEFAHFAGELDHTRASQIGLELYDFFELVKGDILNSFVNIAYDGEVIKIKALDQNEVFANGTLGMFICKELLGFNRLVGIEFSHIPAGEKVAQFHQLDNNFLLSPKKTTSSSKGLKLQCK